MAIKFDTGTGYEFSVCEEGKSGHVIELLSVAHNARCKGF